MESLVFAFYYILNHYAFIATLYIVSLLFKAQLFIKAIKAKKQHYAWIFLLMVIGFLLIANDATWLIWLSRRLFPGFVSESILFFFIRFAWILHVCSYLALALLIESLQENKYILRWYNKIFIICCSILVFLFGYIAFFHINDRPSIEFALLRLSAIFATAATLLISLTSFFRIRKSGLPKILTRQLFVLISVFIVPAIALDASQYILSLLNLDRPIDQPLIACISTLLLTCALYYTLNRILCLRFLNAQDHVSSTDEYNFIDDFKTTIKQFGYASCLSDLNNITQDFFNKAFFVPEEKVRFFLRTIEQRAEGPDDRIAIVEQFVHAKANVGFLASLFESKILIYDEIVFSNFYEASAKYKAFISFLDELKADVFLPIYHEQTMIGYIIIDRAARAEFYTNIDRDQMIILANYVEHIVYFIQHKNVTALLHKGHLVEQELFNKHQEVNQYKEAMQSFLRSPKERKIALLFYKNSRFVLGNQVAEEMFGDALNMQLGTEVTRSLKKLAKGVADFKTVQTTMIKDNNGNKLMVCAFPNPEYSQVMLMAYYPDISDILRNQLDQLKDPSEWDYLLYLETTQSGKLIDRLIPGKGSALLSFKISLLKTALSKKATLLDVPEEDLESLVEVLHHISLRKQLYRLKLTYPVKSVDVGVKLFGINPILGSVSETKPILEQLNETGTLFIENIHFLDMESQENLAHLIMSGFYKLLRTNQEVGSDVRIICSTHKDLQALVKEGTFSEKLYKELNTTVVTLPSLQTLAESELVELAQGYSEQAVQSTPLKNLLELGARDKTKLLGNRPMSLDGLKNRVQQLIVEKSKRHDVYDEVKFDPAFQHADPELAQAASLGRKALRDPKILEMLYQKFQSKSKIALFLGVDRSSVVKRFREFKLN